MQKNYRRTLLACYLGFITQAITANFVPLLYLSFHDNYSISLGRIALIPSAFLSHCLCVIICVIIYAVGIGLIAIRRISRTK